MRDKSLYKCPFCNEDLSTFDQKERGDDTTAILSSEKELEHAKMLGRRVAEAARITKVGLTTVSEEELAWPKKGGVAAIESRKWRDKGWMKTFGDKALAEREKYGYDKNDRNLKLEDKMHMKAWLKRDIPE